MTIVYKCDACGAESGSTDVTPNETPHIYCSSRPEGTWRAPWGVDRALKADPVDHPAHYTAHPSGVECITITEHMNFNLGNAVKYIWRAGLKDSKNHREDLKKAAWYVAREIRRIDIEAKDRAGKTATEKVPSKITSTQAVEYLHDAEEAYCGCGGNDHAECVGEERRHGRSDDDEVPF